MARQLTGPVEIQLPLAVPGPFLSVDVHHRQVGHRRIFVQTADGNVMGVEVHRADGANKVKKAVQAALRVPTEQCNLVFGGHVLKDFSEVRNDAPVLLEKGISRSSSSPCLSPVNFSFSRRTEKCVEVVGGSYLSFRGRSLIQEAVSALDKGVTPERAMGGLGGAYYFKNLRGDKIAIVKPTDEEPFAPNNPNGYVGRTLGQPGLKRNIRVGEAGMREVAAYLLDHKRFANVPHTALVKVTNSCFNVNDSKVKGSRETVHTKIASLQKFVKHDYDASEHGTSGFPVKALHRIGILDIRIFNLDRHSGNILVREVFSDETSTWGNSTARVGDSLELIPIDHGFCLPESLESAYFEWQHWPQASLPFSQEELDYIEALDPYKEVEMLKAELPMLREAALRILVVSTTLLKLGAKAGLSLAEIAGMMCSELRGSAEEASELERLCVLSRERLEVDIAERSECLDESFQELEDEFEQFQLEIEKEGSSDSELGYNRELSFADGLDSMGFRSQMSLSVCRRFAEGGDGVLNGVFSPNSPIALVGFSPPSGKESFDSVSDNSVDGCSELGSVAFPRKSPLLTSRSVGVRLQNGCRNSLRGPALGPRMPRSPTVKSPAKPRPKEGLSGCVESTVERNVWLAELDSGFPAEGSIDFSKLGESTWRKYMRVFEEVLQEGLEVKKEASGVFSKKFGTSCKF